MFVYFNFLNSNESLLYTPEAEEWRDREKPRLPQPFFFTLFFIYLKNNIYKLLLYLY